MQSIDDYYRSSSRMVELKQSYRSVYDRTVLPGPYVLGIRLPLMHRYFDHPLGGS